MQLNHRVIVQKRLDRFDYELDDLKTEWKDIGKSWAKIELHNTAESHNKYKDYELEHRYKIIMRKNYISYTRHAYLIRLLWKNKILSFISEWYECKNPDYVCAIAIAKFNYNGEKNG